MIGGGHPSDEAWSAFLDGDHGEREMARLRAQAAACATCRESLEALRHGMLAARGLDRPDPPVTLWASIEGRLVAEEQVWWRLRPFALGGLAGALLVLGGGVLWWKAVGHGVLVSAPSTSPPPGAVAETNLREVRDPLLGEAEREVAAAAATYERSIAKLRKLLDRQTSAWDPEWRARTTERLARLDDAIAESRRALGSGAVDTASHEILFAAYQRKLDFLADVVNRGTPAVLGKAR
jgi:hypothetical protein